MEGALPIIFLAVVLKIPVLFAMWLIWWAVRDEPSVDDAYGEFDDHTFRRWRRSPAGPRGPRRGPHGGTAHALPDCPPGGRARITARPAPVRASADRHA